jgi:hypothetical protein
MLAEAIGRKLTGYAALLGAPCSSSYSSWRRTQSEEANRIVTIKL